MLGALLHAHRRLPAAMADAQVAHPLQFADVGGCLQREVHLFSSSRKRRLA
jgi:hypothetical protein